MKLISVFSLLLLLNISWGQVAINTQVKTEVQEIPVDSFELYCKNNAATIMELPKEKVGSFPLSGEIDMPSVAEPSYLDYGIVLLEESTQYFTIRGTAKVLKVESLYRLRLSYAQKQQK